MATPVLRPLSTGEVLDVSFSLYRTYFGPLVLVALVTRALPTILQVYVQMEGGALAHIGLGVFNFVLSLILSAMGVAASTLIVSGAYLGHSISAEAALRKAIGLIWPLILLTLMTGLVVTMGLILLIIPGIILLVGLMLATVALVLERLKPTAAMSRSWDLTRGFRMKAFLIIIVAGILFMVPVMLVGMIGGMLSVVGLTSRVAVQVLVAVLGVFVYPFFNAVVTVLYYDLRVRKEGFDLELLAAATQPA